VVEVAVCLYNLELGCPLVCFSSLVRAESNDAENINRIPVAALVDAPPPEGVWTKVAGYIAAAHYVAAHRAEFDRGFVEPAVRSAGYTIATTWVCTKTDFDWPGVGRGDHLTHLALAYGLGVASAHRAMADVDAMARILSRVHEMGHPLVDLFKRAARPKKRFVAMVPYEQRQLAKDAGFLWNDKARQWERSMPPEDTTNLGFRVRESV
jgi:DNA polymerase-3 subunit epsilon